jgi:DNA repair exonuclease SbcCD ATPase subunit
MQIELEKIFIKNFRSYSDKGFTFDFSNPKTTIISGRNGAGKTTLLYAIYYAFFGKVTAKVKQDEIINDINESSMIIELSFSKEDDSYKIIRGLKPKVFEIYKNNKLLPILSNVKDYQSLLENDIVGISHKMFSKLVSVNSSIFQQNFITLTPKERKDFLEEVLSLDVLSKITDISKSDLKALSLNNIDLLHDIDKENNNITHFSNSITHIDKSLDQNKYDSSTLISLESELSNSTLFDLKKIDSDNLTFNTLTIERKNIISKIIPDLDLSDSFLSDLRSKILNGSKRKKWFNENRKKYNSLLNIDFNNKMSLLDEKKLKIEQVINQIKIFTHDIDSNYIFPLSVIELEQKDESLSTDIFNLKNIESDKLTLSDLIISEKALLNKISSFDIDSFSKKSTFLLDLNSKKNILVDNQLSLEKSLSEIPSINDKLSKTSLIKLETTLSKYQNLDLELKNLSKQFNDLSSLDSPKCTLCSSVLSSDHKEIELKKITDRIEYLKSIDIHLKISKSQKSILLFNELTFKLNSLIELDDTYKKNKLSINSIDTQIIKLKDELNILNKDKLIFDESNIKLKDIKQNIDKLSSKIKSLSQFSSLSELKEKQLNNSKLISAFNNLLSISDIPDINLFIKNTFSSLDVINADLEKIYIKFDEFNILDKKFIKEDAFILKLENLISLEKKSLENIKLNSSLIDIDSKLSKISFKEIAPLIKHNELIEKKKNILFNMKEKERNFTSLQQDKKNLLNDIKKSKALLNKLDIKNTTFKSEYSALTDILQVCEKKELKEKIFSQYIPILNESINFILRDFNSPFKIKLENNFSFSFSKRSVEINYETLSKGEQITVNLSIILSFLKIIELRNVFKINLLAFDEIDGGLDTVNLNLVIDKLASIKNKKIIFITHRTDITSNPNYDDFDILKVEKDRFSTVTLE